MSVCILQNVPDLDPGCELRSRWIDSQNIAVYSIDKQGKVDPCLSPLDPRDITVAKMADGTLLHPSLLPSHTQQVQSMVCMRYNGRLLTGTRPPEN